MPILYHTPESVCSQKARIGLAEANVPFQSYIVDTGSGEHFGEAFRKLNPDSVVPVLDDDGVIVRESSLIIEYIDDKYDGARLMPTAHADKVAAKLWLIRCLGIHGAINSVTFATKIRKIDLARSKEEREARWARLHDPVIALKRRDLFENGVASAHVKSAIGALQATVAEIAERVATSGWTAGDQYSIADLALTAYFDRLDRLGLDALWTERPGVIDWLARLRARPSYQTAITDWEGPLPDAKEAEQARRQWIEVLFA